ncbi:MAG: 2-isopropylmalate synthase, partial [Paenibacillus macerans]|nr:2-isopropylmalate synthase [Paenibacillus macerans]
MNRKIIVLDTTLRDGEQVPGAKLNVQQKLEFAQQLKRLRVDIIEAGFPASSQGDFQAVREIARSMGDSVGITALARAVKSDIDAVYESVRIAQDPLIHIVLGASNVHVEKKFNRSKEAVLQMGVDAVKYAKTLLPQVQYSTEDASRADFEYLWKTIEAVVRAGATIVNVPDTVGYAIPEEYGELIRKIHDRLKNLDDKVILSVHCHNDLGLATANTLSAAKNGAEKIECTINGLGERAGNTSLEETVMALKVRESLYRCSTNIDTTE